MKLLKRINDANFACSSFWPEKDVSTEVKAHYACTAFSGFVTRSTHNEAPNISIQLVIVPLLEFCSEILPCLRLFFFSLLKELNSFRYLKNARA